MHQSAHFSQLSHEAGGDAQPTLPKLIQSSFMATPNRVASTYPPMTDTHRYSPGEKSFAHQHSVNPPPRSQHSEASSAIAHSGFESFLNLTQSDETDSPLGARGTRRIVPLYDSLASEHAELLLKYKDLSRRHAQAQSELEAIKSSTPVSTTAVLSGMYSDLEKSYEELEAAYKREVDAGEPFRAKIRELQLELQASNDHIAALRQDFRVQQSRVTDLEVRYHLQGQSLADVTEQSAALQRQLSASAQALAAAESELQHCRTRIHDLNGDVLDAESVSQDLSQQVLRCNNHNKALLEQLNKLISCFDDASLALGPSDGIDQSNSSREPSAQLAALSPDVTPRTPRNMRLKATASSTIRSILEENLRFATSWQSSIQSSSDATQALLNERTAVEELTRKVGDLEQALRASKEQEQLALEDAQKAKQSCDAMIQDIKEKVASAWELEEQKMLRMESQMNSMKMEAEQFALAKQEIAQFKQLAAEHDDMLLRLQSKHELEREHAKLLHEEERVTLKQHYEDEMKRAAAKIDELQRLVQSTESSLSARVQEEMSAHHARFREEQQRFSVQLDNSLESLNEARDQRTRLLEMSSAKTQEIEELTEQLRQLNSVLQRKELEIRALERDKESAAAERAAEVETLRRSASEEAAEMQRLYLQKQAEDKQVLDASWAALAVIRKEIEESALASSQIQMGASMTKLRSSMESEIRQAFETEIADLHARIAEAGIELQQMAADRDAFQQKLQVALQELQQSAELQEQMGMVEQSFSVLRSNLEASAECEAHLREVIQQQEGRLARQQEKLDASAAAAVTLKNLESVVVHLNELLHVKESECEGLLRDQHDLRALVAQHAAENASARDASALQAAEHRAASERLQSISEELKCCQAQLEEETKLRAALQEQLAALAGRGESSASSEDLMQAADGAISRERHSFEQQHAADQSRLLQLQLELKKCKERLRVVESEPASSADHPAD